MNPTYVAQETDDLSCQALGYLEEFGCQTQVLQEGESAPGASIAFFAPIPTAVKWPGRHVRLAAHQLKDVTPEWAKTTPFWIAVRYNQAGSLREATRQAALYYERWLASGLEGLPWGDFPSDNDRLAEVQEWQVHIAQALSTDVTWEVNPALIPPKKKRKKRRGRGFEVTQRVRAPLEGVKLTAEQRQRHALVIAALGAFNFGVGMALPDAKLHRIYLETLKRLALVAEQANAGAGELLFKLASEISLQELLQDMLIDELGVEEAISPETYEFLEVSPEQFMNRVHEALEYLIPGWKAMHQRIVDRIQAEETIKLSVFCEIEAILLYGKPYSQLTSEQQVICRLYRMLDEFQHFSRIMDPDLMLAPKRIVGVADAGNARMTRLLNYGSDYRRRLDLERPWPMPAQVTVEPAVFANPLAPTHVRRQAPHVGGIVSASTPELAKNLIDIFRRLVTQYSLTQALAMLEDWLMAGEPDPDISLSAFRVHNDGDRYWVRAVGVGDGAVVIRGSVNRIIRFPKTGRGYGDIEVGRVDFQHPIWQVTVEVQPGDTIEAVPATFPGLADLTLEKLGDRPLDTSGVARMRASASRQKPLLLFKWTPPYVLDVLSSLIRRIEIIGPKVIRVQVCHIHSDRDFGPEQETAAFMTRIFIAELRKMGFTVIIEPMIDDLHVVNRVNVTQYLADVSTALGEPVDAVAFEASLLSRRLADQAIARLYQRCPDRIRVIGHNVYLVVDDQTMIELYDGVGEELDRPGRQGCVPYEAGYEVRRLNPSLASRLWWDIVMSRYSDSIVAEWWRQDPSLDYEALARKYVYGFNPERRMALLDLMNGQIDEPYNIKVLGDDTAFLDSMLAGVDQAKIVLLHFLEGVYDAQHTKFAKLMDLAGLLPMNIFRVSFERLTGKVVVLDVNNPERPLG